MIAQNVYFNKKIILYFMNEKMNFVLNNYKKLKNNYKYYKYCNNTHHYPLLKINMYLSFSI